MDSRISPLLELFQRACQHYLEPGPLSRLLPLTCEPEQPLPDGLEGVMYAITDLNVSVANSGQLMEHCTLVWLQDTDGLWSQHTLIGPLGVVLSTFRWESDS